MFTTEIDCNMHMQIWTPSARPGTCSDPMFTTEIDCNTHMQMWTPVCAFSECGSAECFANNWNDEDEPMPVGGGATGFPTAAGGFPSRDEFVNRYQENTGFDASRIEYYRAFQYWRLAAIVEGVLSRYIKGVMGEKGDTGAFQAQVDGLAQAAHERMAQI